MDRVLALHAYSILQEHLSHAERLQCPLLSQRSFSSSPAFCDIPRLIYGMVSLRLFPETLCEKRG